MGGCALGIVTVMVDADSAGFDCQMHMCDDWHERQEGLGELTCVCTSMHSNLTMLCAHGFSPSKLFKAHGNVLCHMM